MMERRKNLNAKFGFVDSMKIKDFIDYEQPNEYIVESDRYSSKYSIPVLTAGQSFILGYTNESKGIYKKGPCIIFDDFTTSVHYVDFPFKVKSSAMKILTTKSNADLKYCYYLLLSLSKMPPNHKRQWISTTSEKTHVLPSMDRQISIVKQLDLISDTIANYTNQIENLDNLVKARFVEMFCHKGYTVLEWNDVFNTRTGKLDSNAAIENGKYPFFTCSKDILYIDDFGFDQEALLLAGNNAAGKYDVKYYKGKFNAYQRTYVLTLRGNWSYQLFRYQLEDKLEYLRQQSLGGLTKYLTMKILGELSFIIPPIEKQKEFESFVQQVDKSRFDIKKSITELEREVVYD